MAFLATVCFSSVVDAAILSHSINDETLPSKTIYDIYEDQDGYIWIATPMGVFQYNGTDFKRPSYQHKLLQSPMSNIRGVDRKIWLGMSNEMSALQLWSVPRKITKGSRWLMEPIVCNGDTFLLSASSLYVSLSNIDTVIHYHLSPNDTLGTPTSHLPNITGMTSQSLHQVTIATTKGLYSFSDHQLKRINPKRWAKSEINGICSDSQGMWIASSDRVYRINKAGIAIDSFEIPEHTSSNTMAFSQETGLWFSTQSKKLYNYKNGSLKEYTNEIGLGNSSVNKIFIDRNHNVWLGTNGYGLVFIPNTPFTQITTTDGLSDNWLHDRIRLSNNEHLLLTSSGADYWNESFGAIEKDKSSEKGAYIYQGARISTNTIVIARATKKKHDHVVKQEKNGTCFLIVSGTCIFRQDSANFLYGQHSGRILHHNLNKSISKTISSFSPAAISTIQQYSDSLLLVGTRRGIRSLNAITLRNNSETLKIPNELKELKSSRISQIQLLENGTAMVVYDGKVALFKQGKWSNPIPNQLSGTFFTCLSEIETNKLILGHRKGLVYLNGDSIQEIGSANGLPPGQVHYLSVDQTEHILWIGTDQGIATIRLSELSGLSESTITVKILSLELMSDSVISYPWKDLSFHHRKNDLRINFDLINPAGAEKAKVYYKVNNPKSNWVVAENGNIGLYNLNPGKYQIWISAGYSEKHLRLGKPILFEIETPFWKTTIGLSLLVALLLLLIVIGAYIRIKNIRKSEFEKREVMTEMHKLQQQSLRAMMNPHFIFNALNSVQTFALRNNDKRASQFISHLAKFIRTQMHMLEEQTISLSEEISQLQLYLQLEANRFDNAFQYDIQLDPLLNQTTIKIPPMLIQPFVENAIWHGLLPKDGKKDLVIKVHSTSINTLEIIIEDNGVGLNPNEDKTHQSRGISLIKKRLELHNNGLFDQDCVIGPNANGGVTVRIHLSFSEV